MSPNFNHFIHYFPKFSIQKYWFTAELLILSGITALWITMHIIYNTMIHNVCTCIPENLKSL